MQHINHWAICGSGLFGDSTLINQLMDGKVPSPFSDFENRTGALFSTVTLNRFIKEEAIHDDYSLSEEEHRSIRTFSSGEQKKALLNYLLSKNPDFLVVENVFDMLDKESQNKLVDQLQNLAEKIPIIQLFTRQDTIMPFISHVLHYESGEVVFSGTQEEFKIQNQYIESFVLEGEIPSALNEFEPIEDPLIRFNHVSVNYGEENILNDICWTINRGDFWQLIGPNGSGKTTLLTMITGDNPKAYGQDIVLFGKQKGEGESIWEIKEKIGYVTPAMTVLFNGRQSVENMIISGMRDSIGLYKKPTTLEKKLAGEWIDLIGLTKFKNTNFSRLTEGQQCMVLVARSMIKHPPLLILDEPTHGLDDYSVSVLTCLVNKIAEQSKTTIIYVSHRKEQGLEPTHKYELTPGEKGSTGQDRSKK